MELRKILQKFAHENFTCDICGREVFGGERICAPCRRALPWNDGMTCPHCGRKVREEGLCLQCKDALPAFDSARSALTHEGEAAQLVVRFKRGERYLVKAICEILLPLTKEFQADMLAFVPMTERSERLRGYNQSRLLAEELSAQSGLEIFTHIAKTRETGEQKLLGKRERAKNLKGCFRITERRAVKGKKIIVIDDTMTTGATANEFARLFKRAGAEKVYVVTLTGVQSNANG